MTTIYAPNVHLFNRKIISLETEGQCRKRNNYECILLANCSTVLCAHTHSPEAIILSPVHFTHACMSVCAHSHTLGKRCFVVPQAIKWNKGRGSGFNQYKLPEACSVSGSVLSAIIHCSQTKQDCLSSSFLKFSFFLYIFGSTGSLLLHKDFLYLQRVETTL